MIPKNVFFNRMSRKHCGQWRKWWFPAFSPFLTVFYIDYIPHMTVLFRVYYNLDRH